MNDATDQYFIGLAATDTTLIAGGVWMMLRQGGLYHEAASTDNKISLCYRENHADDKPRCCGKRRMART
jgi:hypothetical protein